MCVCVCVPVCMQTDKLMVFCLRPDLLLPLLSEASLLVRKVEIAGGEGNMKIKGTMGRLGEN